MFKIIVDIPTEIALVDLWNAALAGGWTLVFPPSSDAVEQVSARFPDAVRASDWLRGEQVSGHRSAEIHPDFGYLIHTGGTTGIPKLVHVTAHNVLAYLDGAIPAYGLRRAEGGRMALICAPGFDGSAEECLLAIYCRKTAIACPRDELMNPEGFWRWVEREQLDTLSMPTALFTRVLGERDWRSDHEVRVIVGGEALLTAHARTFLQRAARATLINSYGPSETTIAVSAKTLDAGNISTVTTDVVPIGTPFRGVGFSRTDDGLLAIRGPQVAHYHLEPRSHVFLTGDRVALADGEWQFQGRADGIAKIRGHRVDLLAIENQLSFRGITAAVVVDRRRMRIGVLGAVVGRGAVIDDVFEQSNVRVMPVVRDGEIPLTDRGKRDEDACRAALFDTMTPFEQVLSYGRIVGGTVTFDSIAALEASMLLSEVGKDVDPRALFGEKDIDAVRRLVYGEAPVAIWSGHGEAPAIAELVHDIPHEALQAVLAPTFSRTVAHLGRVFVTGASGFVGGYIARYGDPVAREDLPRVGEFLQSGDVLIHCGAVVNHIATCEALFSANVQLPLTLRAACRRAGAKFVQISTSDVVPAGEVSSPGQLLAALGSGYAQSKALAELALAADPDVLIIRLGHVGPGNENDLAEMILAEAVSQGAAPPASGAIHTMDAPRAARAIVAAATGGYRGLIQLERQTPLRWRDWFRQRGVSRTIALEDWLAHIENPRLGPVKREIAKYLEDDRRFPLIAPPGIARLLEVSAPIEVAGATAYLDFPPPESAAADGLIALGGCLSKQRILSAYSKGIFPWNSAHESVRWWCPDPRFVLFPEKLHISRSLSRVLRRDQFEITFDTCFDGVVDACREPRPGQDATWISDVVAAVYGDLHRDGHAHSVEAWLDGELVAGSYGVLMGGAWFGESMFSRVSNAAKIAFVALTRRLMELGVEIIDCQVHSEHMKALGAEMLPRAEFLRRLAHALRKTTADMAWAAA